MQIEPALDPLLADHIAPRRHQYCAEGLWSEERLGTTVAKHASLRPNDEAVVDRKGLRRISFKELDQLSNRFANWLDAMSIVEGDVISVQLPNCLEAVVIAIGANKAGVVVNPMLTVYRAKELRHMLGMTRAKAIFTPGTYRGFSHRNLALQIAEELQHRIRTEVVDVIDDDANGPSLWLDELASWPDTPCRRQPLASNLSVLLFTSGTEAAPKGVMHSEQTLNCNVRSVWRSLQMSEGEIVWMPSPVGHSAGFNFGIRYALLHGAKLVLQDRWTAEEAVATIERERPTYTLAATIFLTDILRLSHFRRAELSSLRVFGCGGAPIPASVVIEAGKLGITVLRLYGQTETLVASLNRPSSPLQKRIETDGLAVEGFNLEICDEAGSLVPPGTPGELLVAGPGNSLGYFKDVERTRAKFRNGWVYTGDIAVKDADGYIAIVGRKSEIIIRGGLNIAPREVEELIEKIDGIIAVAVVGLPHERLGQICCACIVVSRGVRFTLDQICTKLRSEGLAIYKLPERLEILDALPLTASGKIQRHLIVASLTANAH